MGASYYQCDKCGFGFRDTSEYRVTCDCQAKFCSKECAEPTNYTNYDEETEYRIDPSVDITCVVCREEVWPAPKLLEALLVHYGLSREQAIALVKIKKEGK